MTHAEKIARASEMYRANHTLAEIARELRVHETTARLWIIEGGVEIRKRGPRSGAKDNALDLPIGQLPAGHPFAEFDAQMIAARRRRHPYNPYPAASSIALCSG